MRLVYCPVCQHVRNLEVNNLVVCPCNASGGFIKEDNTVVIVGYQAQLIEFESESFIDAMWDAVTNHRFDRFEARFLDDVDTVKRVNTSEVICKHCGHFPCGCGG